MEVVYPVRSGSVAVGVGAFSNQRTTLQHTLRIYLLSPEETEKYFQIKDQISAKTDVILYLFIAAVFLVGVVILISVFLLMKKTKIKPSWN
jgi:hypothetical protein